MGLQMSAYMYPFLILWLRNCSISIFIISCCFHGLSLSFTNLQPLDLQSEILLTALWNLAVVSIKNMKLNIYESACSFSTYGITTFFLCSISYIPHILFLNLQIMLLHLSLNLYLTQSPLRPGYKLKVRSVSLLKVKVLVFFFFFFFRKPS